MDDPSQTDRATTPGGSDKDYTRVLDMINSVEMQKRLEEARSKRAQVLAERAAGTAGPAALNLVPAAVPLFKDTAGTKPLGPAAPAGAALPGEAAATMVTPSRTAAASGQANPAGMADMVAAPDVSPRAEAPPAAPPATESPRRNAPVLRAPTRLVVSGPAGGVSRIAPRPAKRRNSQSRSVALGLLVGMLAGIGVTQVMDGAMPTPSALTERTPGTGDPPSITVDAVSPTAGQADTATAAPSQLIVPRPRPAQRGDAASADRLAARPAAPVKPPLIRIDDVLRSSRTQSPPIAAAKPESPSAAPPPAPRGALERAVVPTKDVAMPLQVESPQIKIDDVLRTSRAQSPPIAARKPEAPSDAPPLAPLGAPERAILPQEDVATPLQVEPPAATTPPPLGSRLRMVVHRPPDFPEGALVDLRATLREAGFELAETRTVRLRFTRNEVRYYHEEDAANASRIAMAIGAESRDFSFYRPSPSLGTVEVWLAAQR